MEFKSKKTSIEGILIKTNLYKSQTPEKQKEIDNYFTLVKNKFFKETTGSIGYIDSKFYFCNTIKKSKSSLIHEDFLYKMKPDQVTTEPTPLIIHRYKTPL